MENILFYYHYEDEYTQYYINYLIYNSFNLNLIISELYNENSIICQRLKKHYKFSYDKENEEIKIYINEKEYIKLEDIYYYFNKQRLKIESIFIDNLKYIDISILFFKIETIQDIENQKNNLIKIIDNENILYNINHVQILNSNELKILIKKLNLLISRYIKNINLNYDLLIHYINSEDKLLLKNKFILSPLYLLHNKKQNFKNFELKGFDLIYHYFSIKIKIILNNYQYNILMKKIHYLNQIHYYEETLILGLYQLIKEIIISSQIKNISFDLFELKQLKYENPYLWFALLSLDNNLIYQIGEEIILIYHQECQDFNQNI